MMEEVTKNIKVKDYICEWFKNLNEYNLEEINSKVP